VKIIMICLLMIGFASCSEPSVVIDPAPIEVLSINVRTSNASDGDNSWIYRRDIMMEVVKSRNYDFIGAQEVILTSNADRNQYQFMADNLPGYSSLFRPRGSSEASGEGTPLFYRNDRWEADAAEQGTFWLSHTPDVPGSIWEGTDQSQYPRIVTYSLFHEICAKRKRTGFTVYVYNTHFDHVRGTIVQEKEAEMILNRIFERQSQSSPAILIGDLNAHEADRPILFLKGQTVTIDGKTTTPPMALIDSFRVVHPDETDIATIHHYLPHNPTSGRKIDYFFSTSNLIAIDAKIIHDKPEGRFPSDHYPIRATLHYRQ